VGVPDGRRHERTAPGGPVTAVANVLPPVLAAFEPPSTKDFVWGCWGASIDIAGKPLCLNFITFLVLFGFLTFIAFFFFALRKPKIVPGRLQTMAELGIQFVRENIALPMIGPDADRYMPLLATLFFAILFWNLFEVVPGINFAPTSRLAFPLVLGVIAWITYLAVGIRKHGFIGYLRFVLIAPSAPWWLRYTILPPIEFVTVIVMRPLTLALRLAANFLAGHFLLAVFFLGTIALLQGGWIAVFAPFSFGISIILVGFEIFVALLQAFIFSILTASYIGGAMAEEH
jgi:F-type H+-transporting ATPase subunit a